MCWLDAIWYARMWSKHIKCMFGFAFRTYDKKMKLSNCQQIKLTISCTCVCLSIFSVLRFLSFFPFIFQISPPVNSLIHARKNAEKKKYRVKFDFNCNVIQLSIEIARIWKCANYLEGERKKTQIFWIHFFKWNFAAFFSSFSFYRVTYILENFSIRY